LTQLHLKFKIQVINAAPEATMATTPRITPQTLAQHARQLADELERGEGPEFWSGPHWDANRRPMTPMALICARAGYTGRAETTDGMLRAAIGTRAASAVSRFALQVSAASQYARNDAERAADVAPVLRKLASALDTLEVR
jgi:hypothetical protein